MASISCSTCGTQVSEPQTECPSCGTPTGFLPADKPKRTKPLLIGAGAVAGVIVLVLVARLMFSGQESAPPAASPPQQTAVPEAPKAKEVKEAAKPAAPAPVARAPLLPEPVAPQAAAPDAAKNGVHFLAVYAARAEGGELLREVRPVVAPEERAMNEVISGAAGGTSLRPLGLACGPERAPYYAWVASREAAQATVQVQVGAACGFGSLAEAAQSAMDACRKRGGCQKDVAEMQLYAGDMRDSVAEGFRPRPRLSCQFSAGDIVEAWQFIAEKADFRGGCAALL